MYDEVVKYLLTNPSKALGVTKKKVDKNVTTALVITEWILFTIAALIVKPSASIAAGVFIGGIVLTLFAGLLVMVIYRALGCKGDYLEGLSTIAYSLMPLSFGTLIASILFLGKAAGTVIGFAIAAVYGVMSLATLYYSGKTFFKTDMITAFVGTSILLSGAAALLSASLASLSAYTSIHEISAIIKGSSLAPLLGLLKV